MTEFELARRNARYDLYTGPIDGYRYTVKFSDFPLRGHILVFFHTLEEYRRKGILKGFGMQSLLEAGFGLDTQVAHVRYFYPYGDTRRTHNKPKIMARTGNGVAFKSMAIVENDSREREARVMHLNATDPSMVDFSLRQGFICGREETMIPDAAGTPFYKPL